MKRYETPDDVAFALARWAPKGIKKILDPAVGTGILIKPFLRRLVNNKGIVYCVDIDGKVLEFVDDFLSPHLGDSLNLINKDFLDIESNDIVVEDDKLFDCIVMNPPFSGQRKEWREVKIPATTKSPELVKKLPIESVFIVNAVQFLRPQGRILAILPASVISGKASECVRQYLLNIGKISHVHELSKFTFKKVEARVYLFVFEKSTKTKPIKLHNHRLKNPDNIVLSPCSLEDGMRLDYRFYAAKQWFDNLQLRSSNAGWIPLSDLADVYRGNASSPHGVNSAIHTTDYRNGRWNHQRVKNVEGNIGPYVVQPNDFLLKRIGRNCQKSLGMLTGTHGGGCTDCVYIVRPKSEDRKKQLFFALRTILSFKQIEGLILRGSGAEYITLADLEQLNIPINIADIYPDIYSRYYSASVRGQIHKISKYEGLIQRKLIECI
ncbi:MAG: N-6 DNA methylase [Sedimentisphaeraceae bacterium JB056]